MRRVKTDKKPEALDPNTASAGNAASSPGNTSPEPRQRMQQAQLRYVPPENLSLASLEAWKHVLEDNRLPQKRPDAAEFPPDIAPVAACIQMVLDVSRHLFLAADIPCFEPMRLYGCRPESDEGRAHIGEFEMPVLDHCRPGTHQAAFTAAIALVNFMHAHAFDGNSREMLFEAFRQHLSRVTRDNWPNESTLAILQGAYELGVPFYYHGAGVYRLGWGAASVPISRSTSLGDTALSGRLSLQKHVTTALLRDAGLPSSEHRLVFSAKQALEAGEQLGWPVVVKPSDLERGEGVHIDVHKEQLNTVFGSVRAASPKKLVLVERQVSGICHRLFMVNGQLLYAVKRRPMGVRGDGQRTVAELVEEECAKQLEKPLHLRSKIRPLDDLAREALAAAGFSETSIPEPEQYVPLRRIQNTAFGGLGEDMTDVVHPENIRIAAAAAAVCGLQIAGVDIITDDISKPWMSNGAIINEVNFAPAFGSSPTARLHLQHYVQSLLPELGRIPIRAFVGDRRALEAAQSHADDRRLQGIAAFLTTDSMTMDDRGQERFLAADGLHARIRALVMSQEVEELIIVVQTDALLDRPLPLEGIDEVHVAGGRVTSSDEAAAEARHDQVLELLNEWVWRR